MEQNAAWNKFASSGKVADYLKYRQVCNEINLNFEDSFKDADKDRRNSDKTTKNQ